LAWFNAKGTRDLSEAETERQQKEAERQRADVQHQRAELEQQRREQLEAFFAIARL
jgi:hypothetical protein